MDTPRDLWNTIGRYEMPETTEVTQTDMELFLLDLDFTLYQRLLMITEVQPTMAYTDVAMGFTKDLDLTPTVVMRADLHPIGNDGDTAIIVFALAKYTGFGLYDEDDSVCLQLMDADQLKSLVMGEGSQYEQYMRAKQVVDRLDELILDRRTA